MKLIILDNNKHSNNSLLNLEKLDKAFNFNANNTYILLSYEAKIVAYLELNVSENLYFIKRVFVSKSYRYNYYGSILIKYTLEYLARKNLNTVYVKDYAKLKTFFIKNGFDYDSESNLLFYSNIAEEYLKYRESFNVTLISILVNLALTILKVSAGLLGKSRALVSDGIHSLLDLISSFVILIGLSFSKRAQDWEHPFGHGKIEDIITNIISVFLILTAFQLMRGSYVAFSNGQYERPESFLIYITLIAIFIKYLIYVFKYKIGKKLKNQLLLADASEHKSDIISSIGVLFGILLAINFDPKYDLLMSFLFSLIILKDAIKLMFNSVNKILDKQDHELISKFKEFIFTNFSDVKNIHEFYIKSSANDLFISFHIRLNEDLSLKQASFISDKIEIKLKKTYKNIKGVTIHIEPLIN